MNREVFKGQYALSVVLVICTMVFIDVIFSTEVPYVLKAVLGALQVLINVYLLYRACRIRQKKTVIAYGVALAMNIAVTLTGLLYTS